MKRVILGLMVALVCGTMAPLGLVDDAAAQQKMTVEEYTRQLKACQDRLASANAGIADAQKQLAALQGESSSLDQQIAAATEEFYRVCGCTQADIDAFRKELQDLLQEINGLLALSPAELYGQLARVEAIGKRLEEMGQSKIAKIPEIAALYKQVMDAYARLKEAAARAKPSTEIYTVLKGDYLWKISGKSQIYGAPIQWMRLYSFNRDQIKNPNLIYPNQNLKVHRNVIQGEYLVQRGDFLRKIAGLPSVYNDPKRWQELYEANREVIDNPHVQPDVEPGPNRIYPHTVLWVK
jgi:nucleoid-associated protein YgaU